MHALCMRLFQPLPRRIALSAILLCLATALNAQTEKWTTYKYPADGFRVTFPSAPKLEPTQKQAKAGTILMNSYCAQISTTNLCVAVIDHGPEATGLIPEILMGRAKLGVLSAPKTRKLNQVAIDLDGHKGIELEAESDTLHTITRIYIVGDVLYQTMVTYPVGNQYPRANRFLDSFKFIERVRK